jgi:glycosyltransferase involved in cell wall biosynthesis
MNDALLVAPVNHAPLAPSDLACLFPVRNEALRLPDLLRHYRQLGVTRFIVVDNGSRDGSQAWLAGEPDVDLWSSEQPFSESRFGWLWFNELTRVYGQDRWYLVIDADELLVYPGMEALSLPEICARLTRRGVAAIRAPMIDMYPEGSIFQCDFAAGDRLLDAYPYFDGRSYGYRRTKSGGIVLQGGARARIISAAEGRTQNVLEKYPLRFWHRGETFHNPHVHPGVPLSVPPFAALLHFKFLPDFEEKIHDALATGQHWRDSEEYRGYARNLEALACPRNEDSIRYEGPETLVERGVIARWNL